MKLTKPRHRRSSAEGRCPSPAAGYALVAGSLLFLLLGSYAVFFSAFVPVTGVWVRALLLLQPLSGAADTCTYVYVYAFLSRAVVVTDGCWPGTQVLDVLARDTHYKYLVVMLVSSGTGFVIANWVGWQYYRNS